MHSTSSHTRSLPVSSETPRGKDSWTFAPPEPSVSESYLPVIFESFLGQLFPHQGLLLLDETGQLLQSTSKAQELCRSIRLASVSQTNQCVTSLDSAIALPQKVSTLCEFLVDGRCEFSGKPLQLSDDIFFDNGLRIHLNAEWIAVAEQSTPCIFVRLEDITQTAGQRALCDACRYGLTPRETEVWALYLQGFSYRQVSEQLFIAMCTVKKHMKNINSKRRGEIF